MRRKIRLGPRLIAAGLYRKILEVVPVPCVDAVVRSRGKFLLCKRKNRPMRGKWWLIGGRILKNEILQDAVKRKIREETGLRDIKIKKLLAARGTIFNNSEFGPPVHTVNSVFLAEAGAGKLPHPDGQSSELRWFSRIDRRWPRYVKEMLGLAGFD